MTDNQVNWQDRIVGFERKSASQFLAHAQNPRRHPPNQREALRGSLDTIGWYDAVIENRQTGNLIDGHARIEEALSKNDDMPIPVLIVDLSPEEELLALASHDFISSLANYDRDSLDALLRDVQTDDNRLQAMLSDLAVSHGLVEGDNPYNEWVGMPEFEQDDIMAFKTIKVHFNTIEDLEAFAKLLGQTITEKSTYIFYPKQKREDLKALGYTVES